MSQSETTTDTSKYPLRTQRKAETRNRIVTAALKLTGVHGATNVTMAMVAETANVHVTTLFTHFSSKTDLFSGISEPSIAALRARIAECKGQVPFFEFLRTGWEEFISNFVEKEEEVNQALYLRTQVEMLPAWIAYEQAQLEELTSYIQHDYGSSEIEARLFAGMIVTSNIDSFDRWLTSPADFDIAEMSANNIQHIEQIFNAHRARTQKNG